MITVFSDLRYAYRGLRKSPAFTIGVILTLALGIGASAAMFSVVDSLLLRPLPYGESEELVEVRALSPTSAYAEPNFVWEDARVLAERATFFSGVLLHSRRSVLYTGGAQPLTLSAEAVAPEFEEVLEVQPALGRGFVAADALLGAEPVVLLDHAFWRSAFGGNAQVIGERIELDGVRHRITGVMPAGFKFPTYSETEIWLPLPEDGVLLGQAVDWVEIDGRIEGWSFEAAQERATALSLALAETLPGMEWTAQLFRMEDERARGLGLRKALGFLSGAVLLILLISAINAVSLLLVRGWSRIREFSVRIALGASRRRLMRQLLVESTVLAVLSAAVAVGFAVVLLDAIRGLMPDSLTFWAPYAIQVEHRTLAFAFLTAVAAGLLIGLVPALQLTRRGNAAARSGLTPYAAGTPTSSRFRSGLVVGSVGFSVLLLVGAGLLINSFVRLIRVDPGYRVEELAWLNFSLSEARYPDEEARGAFVQRLERRLEALPGVEGVTSPAGGFRGYVQIQAEGAQPLSRGQPQIVPVSTVTPDYFEVFEIPILTGRAFVEEDANTDNAIIDQDLASFLWDGANPLGRRFRLTTEQPWLTVVGVIGDLKLMGPDDRMGDYEILYPGTKRRANSFIGVALRTRGEPAALFASIRAAVHELDSQQPIHELTTMEDIYAESIDMERFLFVLMSVLSSLALLLASIGIHGLLASTVNQRRRELGIRIALGAPTMRLVRNVVLQGARLAAFGATLGLAGALLLSSVVGSLIYGVEPTDGVTVAAVAAVTLAAAIVASYLPARGIARVDPMEALRTE